MKVIAIGLMSLLIMATNVLANPADDQDELQQEAVSEPSTSESPEATSEYDLPTTSNDKPISEQDKQLMLIEGFDHLVLCMNKLAKARDDYNKHTATLQRHNPKETCCSRLKLIKKKFLGIDKELQDKNNADVREKQQEKETQKARLAMVQMVSNESSTMYMTQQNAMQIPAYRKYFKEAQERLKAKLASETQGSDTNSQSPLDSKLPLDSNTKVKKRPLDSQLPLDSNIKVKKRFLDSQFPLNSNTKVKDMFGLKIKRTRLFWRK
ncbi:hypothetical protein BASA50_007207 [Batrachochytrium salamandrivorans]|uniref:Uncharacterized protein n=1 Tax=Batrachochytrium salamandrivorans TaxID=1357716 RepID=A0ABQ8F7U5_9FUNG|nr:hypothetical protein BASA60_011294 [Batrachochytrium salamandrivorans]KAH6593649.1 hypothetical protein BASA50_007207 [Batrachochytrium salamandrivorans]